MLSSSITTFSLRLLFIVLLYAMPKIHYTRFSVTSGKLPTCYGLATGKLVKWILAFMRNNLMMMMIIICLRSAERIRKLRCDVCGCVKKYATLFCCVNSCVALRLEMLENAHERSDSDRYGDRTTDTQTHREVGPIFLRLPACPSLSVCRSFIAA